MFASPDYEDILRQVGGFGRYQLWVYGWYLLNILLVAPQIGFMTFGNAKPEYVNISRESIIPVENMTMKNSQHGPAANFSAYVSVPLPGSFVSIASEWDLLDKTGQARVARITSLQMVGVLVGPLFAGPLSDRFGRKPIYVLCYLGLAASGLSSAFCPTLETYEVARCILGVFLGGVIIILPVLLTETLTASWRLLMFFLNWPLGYIWLGCLALLTDNWRTLTICLHSTVPLTLLATFFVHESPKWLLQRGRSQDAHAALVAIAHRNRVILPNAKSFFEEHMQLMLEDSFDSKHDGGKVHSRTFGYWNLFYSRRAIIECGVLMYSWFVTSLVFYGLLFNMHSLSGNLTWNFIIVMMARLVTNSCLPLLDRWLPRLGRRMLHQVGLFAMALCMLTMIVAHIDGIFYDKSLAVIHSTPITIVSIIGLCAAGFAWAAIELYVVELFPTLLRNMGQALCTTAARVGTIIAPQLVLLYNTWKPSFYIVPLALLVTNCIAAFVVLPETKGKPLPDLPTSDKKAVSKPVTPL